MNRLIILLAICGTLIVSVAVAGSTLAQTEPDMTEEKIEHIRRNCVSAQTTLYQLHASDGLLRVNRGPLYEFISTKLMAPLNSRIALNRLEGLELTATTLEYDRQRDSFFSSYKQYEEAMSRTLEISCVNQPVAFYDSLKDTRTKREKVHADTKALNTLLETYRVNFENFVSKTQKDDV